MAPNMSALEKKPGDDVCIVEVGGVSALPIYGVWRVLFSVRFVLLHAMDHLQSCFFLSQVNKLKCFVIRLPNSSGVMWFFCKGVLQIDIVYFKNSLVDQPWYLFYGGYLTKSIWKM